ncbi:MAG: DUF229 domain-containing protein, partial [Kiritimatiellaceae bacterium]|nr:DUF229 domain-containing protein [Kiritimatiellaceae bacterium]
KLGALDRLAKGTKPFCLTVSFHSPHPPFTPSGYYYDYYKALEGNMLLPDSYTGADAANSGWKKESDPGYQNASQLKNWMVSYYALCEEVDDYVGKLLAKLDQYGIADNTLVVFVADHGESLGAHGCRSKNKFWEESVHVPMLMRLPGKIAAGAVVEESVATLDCVATTLDYLGAGSHNVSDGRSLRRFIEKQNYNKDFDDEAIVTEWDFRTPQTDGKLDRVLGEEVNFMVKKGPWKLMMTKKATSSKNDMLYNLESDPYEMYNYIGTNGMKAADASIGKAEHLKCLLMEWMQRMDGGTNKYFSDKKWNDGEGLGDLGEIKARRQWKSLNIWVSDTAVKMGAPVSVSGQLTRNEYIYLGRTTSGTLTVSNISVQGANASLFQISEFTSGTITSGNYKRVKVTYRPPSASQTVTDARIVIKHSAGSDKVITLSATSGGPANLPPYFTEDPFSKPNATTGVLYDEPFEGKTIDPEGGVKTFSKVSGPVWLSVTSGGRAQGTPGSVDVGTNSFMVKVTDNGGLSATATMKIVVVAGQLALPAVGSIITLKAVNGSYVTATHSTNNALIANKSTVSDYERFKVVDATNSIALQCMGNSLFVSIDKADGGRAMVANRTKIGGFEKYQLVQSGSQIAIQSVSNMNYVSAISNGASPLQANQTSIGSSEKFTWKVE